MVYYNSSVLIGLQAMVSELIYNGPQCMVGLDVSARKAREHKINIAILCIFLIKQLFHSRLLDVGLVIANASSWNNC